MFEALLISLPLCVCLFSAALLSASCLRHPCVAHGRLLVFFVVASGLYLGHYIFFVHARELIPLTDTLYNFCNPAVYPLYYLYLMELTEPRPLLRRHGLWLLPAAVCMGAVGVLYGLMSGEETAAFVDGFLYRNCWDDLTELALWQAWAHMLTRLVFLVELPLITWLGMRRLRSFEAFCRTCTADMATPLGQMRRLLWFFLLTACVSVACGLLGRHVFDGSQWLLAIPSLLFSTLLFLIGFVGWEVRTCRRELAAGLAKVSAQTPGTAAAGLTAVPAQLQKQIVTIMHEQRLFLQPNLKVADLAERLGTNRNYIYLAINKGMGISFSDLVNQLRVEYALKLKENHPDLSMKEIAFKAGFSSSASFYRNFRAFRDNPSSKPAN